MAEIYYPKFAEGRGPGYWLNPLNLSAARRKVFRVDNSVNWRQTYDPFPNRQSSVSFKELLGERYSTQGFRFIILADTGEGDRSQYGLLPLIRAMNADFIIINGDVAYPAGRADSSNRNKNDFLAGFFEPYRALNCPIWATCGNHEYYSSNDGRDFYDIFCTRKYDDYWDNYGLKHKTLQPGMFWELHDRTGLSKLTIIGLDSGKDGNPDGKSSWWQFGYRKTPDDLQHNWLRERLETAQKNSEKVLILFHIPALVRGKKASVNMLTLHSIIARYSCVWAVITGHEHNYQYYPPAVFSSFLSHEMKVTCGENFQPHYFVSGGGGAALEGTDFDCEYLPDTRYPSAAEWKTAFSSMKSIVNKIGMNKFAVGRTVNQIFDPDEAKYLSFLRVDVSASDCSITPVFMEDINRLYRHLPPETIVDIMNPGDKPDKDEVDRCLRNSFK